MVVTRLGAEELSRSSKSIDPSTEKVQTAKHLLDFSAEGALPDNLRIPVITLWLLASTPCLLAQTSLPCPVHVEAEKDSPAIAQVIIELDAQQWKTTSAAESADIEGTLRSAETFQSNWIRDLKGRLQALKAIRHGDEDVLLARWDPRAKDREIRRVQMWDGARYELVIFEINPAIADSEESLRRFVRSIVKPPPEKLRIKGPTERDLLDGFSLFRPGVSGELWRGAILRVPVHQVAGFDEQYFTVQEVSGRVFLGFDFGKRAAYAPWPQSIYLNDRFPPLAARVQRWGKEQLLAEITAPQRVASCWNEELMGLPRDSFRVERDQVLIAEAVRRGLDPHDFQAVMDSPNGRELLIPQLLAAGDAESYRELILQTIHRYESLPDVNQDISPNRKAVPVRSHLAELMTALRLRGAPDFSNTMLELAAAGHEPDVALSYLRERLVFTQIRFDDSYSQELADKLAAAHVPAGSEFNRDFIVKWIRSQRSH